MNIEEKLSHVVLEIKKSEKLTAPQLERINSILEYVSAGEEDLAFQFLTSFLLSENVDIDNECLTDFLVLSQYLGTHFPLNLHWENFHDKNFFTKDRYGISSIEDGYFPIFFKDMRFKFNLFMAFIEANNFSISAKNLSNYQILFSIYRSGSAKLDLEKICRLIEEIIDVLKRESLKNADILHIENAIKNGNYEEAYFFIDELLSTYTCSIDIPTLKKLAMVSNDWGNIRVEKMMLNIVNDLSLVMDENQKKEFGLETRKFFDIPRKSGVKERLAPLFMYIANFIRDHKLIVSGDVCSRLMDLFIILLPNKLPE